MMHINTWPDMYHMLPGYFSLFYAVVKQGAFAKKQKSTKVRLFCKSEQQAFNKIQPEAGYNKMLLFGNA